MARHFRPVDRDQPFLLPPDMREWLPAGHLAWFVIDAVAALDVSRFAVRVTPRGSAAGRAAFDPRAGRPAAVTGPCSAATPGAAWQLR
jgi:hypothetical protein